MKNGINLYKQLSPVNPNAIISNRNFVFASSLMSPSLIYNASNDLHHSFSPSNFYLRSSSTNNVVVIQKAKGKRKEKDKEKEKEKGMVDNNVDSKITFGERLYRKGMASKNNIKEKTKALHSRLLKKEMSQCTFKPKTLKVIGIEKYINLAQYNSKGNHNYNNKKSTTRNHSKSTYETNNNNNNNNPNQSTRSKISKKPIITTSYCNTHYISTTNNNNVDKTSKSKQCKIQKQNKNELILHSIKLFNDSKQLQDKQIENRDNYYREHYPFKPFISKSQERVPAKKYYQKDSMINFFHRLQSWLTHHDNTLRKECEEELYDRDTGFRLYSPQINHIALNDTKIRLGNSNTIGNKWEELYLEAKTRQSKIIQTEQNKIEVIFNKSNSTFFSPRSKEIISSLLKKIFTKIFIAISPNGRFINKHAIDLEGIDVKIIEILFPIFYELEEKHNTMSKEEFYVSCKALYETVTVYEKNVLLEWYFSLCKKKQSERSTSLLENPFTFKPKLNHNRTSSNLNSNNASIIKERYSKKEIGDMCTFRPNQCGSIFNITPIDFNGSNNRITEEL